jgi:hypothetical protein
MSEVQLGSTVLYQPTVKEWAVQSQATAFVVAYDDEAKPPQAWLVVLHPNTGYIGQVKGPITEGEGYGQFLPLGQESKAAKAAKEKREADKKAAEETAKQEEEKAEKMREEAKEKTAFPTTQQQLDRDQARAIAQYKYPQPTE